jgi:RNA methyltransferase, TrmH family
MLDNPKSERVKGISRLNQKDARSETGLFLLEGPQGLKELVQRPEWALEVFVTEAASERYRKELGELKSQGVGIEHCSDRVMEKICDTTTPQGVVAVVEQVDISLEQLFETKPKLIAVLDQVRDPGNAGTVLRAADAAGCDAVIFTKDSVDLYNPKLVRSTAGSILHLQLVTQVEPEDLMAALQAHQIQSFATSGSGVPITSLKAELAQPTAWIFGNEAHGVSPELLQQSDSVVSLPIYGLAESLNLATAASVCLYASAFEQHAQH